MLRRDYVNVNAMLNLMKRSAQPEEEMCGGVRLDEEEDIASRQSAEEKDRPPYE